MQKRIFDDQDIKEKKGGPENRMNDLSYTEWMKFQKSFFWITNDQDVFIKSVTFFTKEVWPDGSCSHTLIIGLRRINPKRLNDKRNIDYSEKIDCIDDILSEIEKRIRVGKVYDFILIDLRPLLNDVKELNLFLRGYSDQFFQGIKSLLVQDRYAQILISHKSKTGSGFPIAWSLAQASRKFLRLRDEKIGLDKEIGFLDYFLFFQNNTDFVFKRIITPDNISYISDDFGIPNFLFPKPPPRKKNEVLHPAKFPETLVSDFIEKFSNPGDIVFDPMVGTGSTVIAANRIGRNGYGIDLIPEFVKIATSRISNEQNPSLFDEYKNNVEGKVFVGDATKISSIKELKNKSFDYVITSPPYWSMLNNPGSENQKNRKKKGLSLTYSKNKLDLGNEEDYNTFLGLLNIVYNSLAAKLNNEGKMTIIVKNVKRNHILYPLAWDIVEMLCKVNGKFEYLGNTFWCQDDIGLKPFAVGTHWVSNILHQYCLHFQKRND
jgi:DNA modification methylase